MNIIQTYNQLQGKRLSRSKVRQLIREAKKENIQEIVQKLTGLLRLFPNERGFEFSSVTPIVVHDDFEALGIPHLDPELENELGSSEIEGLGKRVSNDDIYKMITNKFVKIIEENDRMPWSSGFNKTKEKEAGFSFSNLPINYSSSKYYRGINALVLSMYRYHTEETKGKVYITSKGFEQGEVEMIEDDRLFWLTFKQIKEAGGTLKKDSLSQQAIYYNWIFTYQGKKISEQKYKELKFKFGCSNSSTSDNCKALQKIGFLKYYNVFNERDIEGIDFNKKRVKLKSKAMEVKTEEQKILAADLMLKNMPLKPKLEIKHIDPNKNESPYYSPSLDKVVMPQKSQFDSLSQWYGIAFHEHIHATGHAKRTDRRSIKGFTRGKRWGDPQYALEELVAEIGSAFLNAESGILLDNLKNNAAYIKGWQKGVKKHLQKDNKAIFIAAGQSQKAADYILNFNKDGDPAYWNEYERIQKEIQVKGKKQADTKKEKPKNIKVKKEAVIVKSSSDEENLNQIMVELAYDKSMSFKKAVEFVLKDKFNLDKYRTFIKLFLNGTIKKKLTKKQTIEIDDLGTFTVKPQSQNMVKPRNLNFRDSVVMMNKEVASRDELRPVMMHVLHEKNYLIATDAHALSIIKVVKEEKSTNALYDKTGRKIENIGIYPKYKAVIPKDNIFVRKFNLKELITQMKGIVKAQGCIEANGLYGVIVHDGKEIYFNPAIMLKALIPLYKNGVTEANLYVGETNRAILFKDAADENQLALCMPVMGGFDDKIVAEIHGNFTNVKNGLKGIPKKHSQINLFDPSMVRKKKKFKSKVTVPAQKSKTKPVDPIGVPVRGPILQNDYKPKSPLVKGISHVSKPNDNFEIGGSIGEFLGDIEIKPAGSVACTIDAPQGAGKTRFFFQIMNHLSKNYKVLFISLEEHPASSLFKSKVEQYIEPENQNNIDTIGALARGKEKQILDELIPQYDIILVDSWNKIYETAKLDFDNDLRKAYNGKLIFAIFQRTVTGTMRGGSKSQFDGDIIMKIDKGEDFKQNEVYHDKNRYLNRDLGELKYNIYGQGLTKNSLTHNTKTKVETQIVEVDDEWGDVSV